MQIGQELLKISWQWMSLIKQMQIFACYFDAQKVHKLHTVTTIQCCHHEKGSSNQPHNNKHMKIREHLP